ncbi:MAG: Hsp20/alpha crystallin family protein [Spirochaetales bacterium]|nr:Hsp20/alpha crystallin family protein [Spirochaetales bacterium]
MNYLTTRTYKPVNLVNEMDRMFNQLFDSAPVSASRSFPVDILENTDSYRIEAEIPGFTAEDVDVKVDDNLLIIEAIKPNLDTKDEAVKEEWRVRERSQGNRKRSFVLPDDVEKSKVHAEISDGILIVELKKKPETKPVSIKVKTK